MYDTIIELRVRNHPGVMSQITGLFARRAFNLEGIFCGPEKDAGNSRMLLLVYKNERMDQLVKQLAKLYDVLWVCVRPDTDPRPFQINENTINMNEIATTAPMPMGSAP